MIITADHGEEFGEHKGYGHKAKLYNELIRVPLIPYYPDVFGKGIIKYSVNLIDLVPTILSLFHIRRFPPFLSILSDSYYGKSGTLSNARKALFELLSVQTESIKYIFHRDLSSNNITTYEVYDVIHDPWEKKNISNYVNDKKVHELANAASKYKRVRSEVSFIHDPVKPNFNIV